MNEPKEALRNFTVLAAVGGLENMDRNSIILLTAR